MNWESAKLPADALYDDEISDGELRTLAKLYDLAWNENAGEVGDIGPIDVDELADAFEIGRATLYKHLRSLEDGKYLERRISQSKHVGLLIELLPEGESRIRDSRPTTTTTAIGRGTSFENDSVVEESRIRDSRLYDVLREAGIGEPLRSRIASDPDVGLEYVERHIRFAELRGDPVRILAHRLKVRDPKPSDRAIAELDPEGPEALDRYRKWGSG